MHVAVCPHEHNIHHFIQLTHTRTHRTPHTPLKHTTLPNSHTQDVCFKPFGDACATQSILQYWHMDPHAYETRASHTPEYCFTHTTECRSAFQAPIDPALVLGGFPRDVVERRNYRCGGWGGGGGGGGGDGGVGGCWWCDTRMV